MKEQGDVRPDADLFFESSWEVCNKVGGIYTVVKSKVEPMISFYGEGYHMIGPYLHDASMREFEDLACPRMIKEVFDELSREGIQCHYGRWLTEGHPKVILIDFNDFSYKKDEIKRLMWEHFQVDSLGSSFWDFDTPIIWGWAVGMFLEKIQLRNKEKRIVAQFHEWMAASASLYLKIHEVPIGTVFTTHATMLGRTLASSGVDLYACMETIDPASEAKKRGVMDKWSMERACALHSSVFTTVSEITGIEAEKMLGKRADVLLLNGLDMHKFPTFEEVSIKHRNLKNHLKEFLMYYFFPYYSFDLEQTLFAFIAGRYEYRDKGMDIMTDALSGLNSWMKEETPKKTLVVFYWVPSNPRNIRQDVIESKTYYENLKDTLVDEKHEIWLRMIAQLITGGSFSKDTLLTEAMMNDIKKNLNMLKREGTPPLCTHDLFDEQNDPIMSGFKRNQLWNRNEDRVKVINYPIYLTGADRLLDTDYYESLLACHLGIFPSYYEPWGYTPFETAALGISAITTDLAGFGRYIQDRYPDDDENKGVYVIPRMDKSYEESKQLLIDCLKRFVTLEKHDRIQNKIRAHKLAFQADWKNLAKNYIIAHNLALQKSAIQ